ncbi:MAG: hypothetical protein R3272_13185 [Candidatus Promineifilaceae bacterium]|nr:hypothetical protein [Candidatus Promineifilaceae bacterium]
MSDFPTIFDWLQRLDHLRGLPAAYAVIVAAAVIAVMWDWRVTLLALAIHYLAGTLLFVEVLEPRLAIVKLLVGLFVCLMLYLTGRQVDDYRRFVARRYTQERTSGLHRLREMRLREPVAVLVRIALALAVILFLATLARHPAYRLPAIPAPVNLAVFILLGLALLSLSLKPSPLQAGVALLLLMSGFELFYSALDQSVLTLLLLAAANLLITVGVAFLAQAQALSARPPTPTFEEAEPSPFTMQESSS